NQNPISTPAVAPIAKASRDSASVTHRCRQIVPPAKSLNTRAATSPGVEKKNGGSTATPKYSSVLRTCHSPITATATMAWSRRSLARDMKCSCVGWVERKRNPSRPSMGFARAQPILRISLHYFRLEHRPYLPAQILERLFVLHL